jgi:hypothetical protein
MQRSMTAVSRRGPVVLVFMLAAGAAHAQTASDPRWTEWMGCWELVADGSTTRLPPAEEAAAGAGPIRPGASRDARVCVAPSQGGAELRTMVGEQQVLTQTIVADGKDHAISDAGCTGTQRAQWSADGLRLFSRAQVTCDGQAPRTVTGLALMGRDDQWIDVQAVTVEGRDSVRVRRFRPAADRVKTAPPAAAIGLRIEHIKEASALLAPRALEAALIETGARFPLSSKTLLDLNTAGVADSVTDLMVALSYPQAFAVRSTGPDDRLAPPPPLYPDFFDASFESPFYYSPFYSPYYSNYYYSPYFFSPFGYSYLRLYPQFAAPGVVIIPGDGGGGGLPGNGRPENGKAVDGLGYTRVYPRDRGATGADGSGEATSRSGGSSRGSVSPRGYTAGESSGGSSSSSGGASSSGGSGGGSSAGSSGGGGRTAVPK